MPFPVVDVSAWELAGVEVVGRTEHPWLKEVSSGELYLWKPASGTRFDRREHLAEKIASELAQLVGVPCARVELAVRDGVLGCVSRNVQPSGWERRFGEDLLLNLDPGFRATDKRHVTYSVSNVRTVLQGVAPPHGVPDDDRALRTGFDVFTGFLVFDALVLNRDRHAKNWATLRHRRTGAERLCALYDNASSLGLSLSEARAERIVGGKGADPYVQRECWARSFAQRDGRDSTLFEIATDALDGCSPRARQHWLERVAAVDSGAVSNVLGAVPGLSEPLRTLIPMLVSSAQRRLVGDG
ncbi:MAG TPA: HipA domain-containing protein [Mycobacteriales bacterium]|nr:HipA domain-containing protein [Mycobacteriales bacterium]